jgi:hypothetical protein
MLCQSRYFSRQPWTAQEVNIFSHACELHLHEVCRPIVLRNYCYLNACISNCSLAKMVYTISHNFQVEPMHAKLTKIKLPSISLGGVGLCVYPIMATLAVDRLCNAAQVTYTAGRQAVHGTSAPPGSPGLETVIIDLEHGEYFTNISGTILTYPGAPGPVRGVASLRFVTNKQLFGPFGIVTIDKPFEVQGPVYAFHGAVTRGYMTEVLTAIGFWKLPPSRHFATG